MTQFFEQQFKPVVDLINGSTRLIGGNSNISSQDVKILKAYVKLKRTFRKLFKSYANNIDHNKRDYDIIAGDLLNREFLENSYTFVKREENGFDLLLPGYGEMESKHLEIDENSYRDGKLIFEELSIPLDKQHEKDSRERALKYNVFGFFVYKNGEPVFAMMVWDFHGKEELVELYSKKQKDFKRRLKRRKLMGKKGVGRNAFPVSFSEIIQAIPANKLLYWDQKNSFHYKHSDQCLKFGMKTAF